MEDLLGYGSSSSSGGDSDGDDHMQPLPPPSKRAKTSSEPAAVGDAPAAVAVPEGGPPVPPGPALPSAAEALGTGDGREEEAAGGAGAHHGRIRSFAHVEGNYPTHVYLTVGVPEKARLPLLSFLQQVKARVPGLEPVGESGSQPPSLLGSSQSSSSSGGGMGSRGGGLVQPQYHVSLSRTVPIRLQQIESLVAALKKELRRLEAFSLAIGGPEVLVNDERSRTFLALSATAAAPAGRGGAAAATRGQGQGGGGRAGAGGGSLANGSGSSGNPLLKAIDATSRAFQLHGLPRFYAEPRPHISVAWLLGDCERQLDAALATAAGGRGALHKAAEQLAACRWQLQVDKIYCKSGQRTVVVWESR